jgi:hypothetical protein
MAITAFTSPVSGLWPLGKISVGTPGTAVALNTNVGAQTNGTPTTRPSGNVNQLILMAPATNTALVYLIRKVNGLTVSKANTNFIVAILGPGQTVSLPATQMVGTAINLDDYVVDADTAANFVIPTAVVGA